MDLHLGCRDDNADLLRRIRAASHYLGAAGDPLGMPDPAGKGPSAGDAVTPVSGYGFPAERSHARCHGGLASDENLANGFVGKKGGHVGQASRADHQTPAG